VYFLVYGWLLGLWETGRDSWALARKMVNSVLDGVRGAVGCDAGGDCTSTSTCANCGEPGTKRCFVCKSVRYCSKACQAKHWPEHKRVCDNLKSKYLSVRSSANGKDVASDRASARGDGTRAGEDVNAESEEKRRRANNNNSVLYAPLQYVAKDDVVRQLFPFSPPENSQRAGNGDSREGERERCEAAVEEDAVSGCGASADNGHECKRPTSGTDAHGDDESVIETAVECHQRLKASMSHALVTRPRGLMNCGNTCFANSVLQCLVSTTPLACFFLRRFFASSLEDAGQQQALSSFRGRSLCRKRDNTGKKATSLVSSLADFFVKALPSDKDRAAIDPSGDRDAFSPRALVSRVREFCREMHFGGQHDAHEFLQGVLESMQKAELVPFGGEKMVDFRSQETTILYQTFGGYLMSQVKCPLCKYESNTFDSTLDLTLEITKSGVDSVEKALQGFTKVEKLDGDNAWKCENCKRKVEARKQLTLHTAPNVLVIVLKRYTPGRFGKLNKRISFPNRLDLTPYMSVAHLDNSHSGKTSVESCCGMASTSADGAKSDAQTHQQDQAVVKNESFHHVFDSPPAPYQLYGVLVHLDAMRSSFSGHYVCYVRRCPPAVDTGVVAARGDGDEEECGDAVWYKCDDSVVTEVSWETVKSQGAYMLFYERQTFRAHPMSIAREMLKQARNVAGVSVVSAWQLTSKLPRASKSRELDREVTGDTPVEHEGSEDIPRKLLSDVRPSGVPCADPGNHVRSSECPTRRQGYSCADKLVHLPDEPVACSGTIANRTTCVEQALEGDGLQEPAVIGAAFTCIADRAQRVAAESSTTLPGMSEDSHVGTQCLTEATRSADETAVADSQGCPRVVGPETEQVACPSKVANVAGRKSETPVTNGEPCATHSQEVEPEYDVSCNAESVKLKVKMPLASSSRSTGMEALIRASVVEVFVPGMYSLYVDLVQHFGPDIQVSEEGSRAQFESKTRTLHITARRNRVSCNGDHSLQNRKAQGQTAIVRETNEAITQRETEIAMGPRAVLVNGGSGRVPNCVIPPSDDKLLRSQLAKGEDVFGGLAKDGPREILAGSPVN